MQAHIITLFKEDRVDELKQNLGVCAVIVDQTNSLIDAALKSKSSKLMFQFLVPKDSFDIHMVFAKIDVIGNGFEFLKWLIRHEKIDFIEMLEELKKRRSSFTLEYFADHIPSGVDRAKALEIINAALQKTGQDSSPKKSEDVPCEQENQNDDKFNKNITKAMCCAIQAKEWKSLEKIVKLNMGNPNEAAKILYASTQTHANDYLIALALMKHEKFNARENDLMWIGAATRGWDHVLEILVAQIKK